MTQAQVVSYPIPAYSNVPINPQFYVPKKYFISSITLGQTTTVTTTADHDYVIGQLVRFNIVKENATIQLNGQSGYVISIPASNQVLVNIDSSSYDSFKSYTQVSVFSSIGTAGASVWSFNIFTLLGLSQTSIVAGSVYIGLPGVDLLVDQGNGTILGSFPLADFGTIDYSNGDMSITYSGVVVADAFARVTYNTTQLTKSQIIAIGNINSGNINTSGNVNTGTYIPGSFINISPL